MSGFDPSAFVQAEQQSLPLSPPVAKPETSPEPLPATVESPAPPAFEADPAPAVASVATVAGVIADLCDDAPFAAEINRMFRYPLPQCFMPSAWFRIRETIRRFVDEGQCAAAIACGWEPLDLFGFPATPWAYNRQPLYMLGVVFHMRGRKCGGISARSIEIMQRSGPSLRCYKSHHMTGRQASLLCWEALDPSRWPVKKVP